jgi:hypothetical protein
MTTKYTREQLLELLRAKDPVVVTFTKVDGTVRDLYCTLNEELIPTDKLPKNEKTLKENLSVIRVFDLGEAKGWRSFRVDSVTGHTVIRS